MSNDQDWTQPAAMAIPKGGTFAEERGRYGPIFSQNACVLRLYDHREGEAGPSFLEYGEYPYVTADEIKKALRLKAAFSTMLDQMQ